MSSRSGGFLGKGNRGTGAIAPVRMSLYFLATMAVVLVGIGTSMSAGAAPARAPSGAGAGSNVIGDAYTALSPCRVEDTRPTAVAAGGNVSVTVTGTFCGETVPSNAAAVVVNLTITQASGSAGFVALYPTGNPSSTSNINFNPGTTWANLATIPVGTGGSITAHNGQPSGSVQIILDLEGYYAPVSSGSTAGQFVPLTPSRIEDTRTDSKTLGPGATLNLQVTGAGGVPSSGVSAVVFNLTATNGSAGTFFTAWPTGSTQPTASNLNLPGGDTRPNRVIVPVGTGGMVSIFNAVGRWDVVVDVNGYYTDSTSAHGAGSLFTAVSPPARLEDTRTDHTTLGPGATDTLAVAGHSGVDPNATAFVGNLTDSGPTTGTFLTAFPAGASQPVASDLNPGAGEVAANMIQLKLGSGGMSVFNDLGSVDIIVDVFGFFAPAPTVAVSANPATITGNGTDTSTITVTVSDVDGNGVSGDALTMALSGSPAAACGMLNTTTGTTNGSGQATFTYTASTTAGDCTVKATEGDTGASGQGVVHQAAGAPFHVSCSPTTAPPSTSSATTQGNISCTATALPANTTVDLALFPTQGVNAPATNSGGLWTFNPSGTNEALGEATSNANTGTSPGAPNQGGGCITGFTCAAYIASTNGGATSNAPDQVNGISTGPSGSITFVVNSFTTDGAVPVVWTDTDGDNTLGLDPTTHEPNEGAGAAANTGFGIGQFLSWQPPAAPTGVSPDGYYVQSVDHTNSTFVGCPDDSGNTNVTPFTNCLTFTYNQSGSQYCYNAGGTGYSALNCTAFSAPFFQISLAQFDSMLSGFTPAPPASTGFPPAVPGDLIFVASYNAAGPSEFVFTSSTAGGDGDVPNAVTGLTTSSPSAGVAKLTWTGPGNIDVAQDTDNSAGYRIWRMPDGTCTAGKWGIIATTTAAGGTAPATTFTDASACVGGGGSFTYAVAAVPDTHNNTTHDIGPLSNNSSVTVAATPPPPPIPPVSTQSILTQGTNAGNNPDILDNGDTIQFLFDPATVSNTNPVVVAPTASFTFADNYGEQSTVTCGTNATCSVSNNGTQLNIALTANPVQVNPATAGSGSPTPSFLNTQFVGVALVSQNGVSNSAGGWNRAISSQDSDTAEFFANGWAAQKGTGAFNGPVTIMFDGVSTTGTSTQCNDDKAGCFIPPFPEPFTDLNPQFTAPITPTVPNTINIAAGDANAATGDPVTIFTNNGVVIGSGTYNSASGVTITTTQSFNNGDLLWATYQDTNGTLDNATSGPSNQPSFSTAINVLNFEWDHEPIATTGSLGNSQNVTLNLSGVTPNGNVWLTFASAGGSATVGSTALNATCQQFTANSAGQLQVIYTSASNATSLSSGTDDVVAWPSSACGATAEEDTSYTYSQPTSAANSTVTNGCSSKDPADNTTLCTVTVTLIDTAGNPVSGKTVTLSPNPSTHSVICNASGASCSGAGATGVACNASASCTTNGAGQAVFKVRDGTIESVVYKGNDTTDSLTVTQDTTVVFESADAGQSHVDADFPSSSFTSSDQGGNTVFPIRVTIKDADGVVMQNKSVQLKAGSGSSSICNAPGAGGCVAGTTGKTLTTDANGQIIFSVLDSTASETITYTATVDAGSGSPVIVSETAIVAFGAGHNVTLNSITMGSSAHGATTNYGVTFTANATDAALGTSSSINLYFPAGTALPTALGNYTIADQSHTATATVTNIATSTYSPDQGPGYSLVTISLSCVGCMVSDQYLVSISGVTNPAAGTYDLWLNTSSSGDLTTDVTKAYTIT